MKSVLYTVAIMGATAFVAPEVWAEPPATMEQASIQGNEIWVLQDGVLKSKLNSKQLQSGVIVDVNGVPISAANTYPKAFCRPQQPPQTPAPQPPAYTPPPFIAPEVEVDVPESASSGPSLLDILLTVGGGAIGWFVGRQTADGDSEEDDAEAAAEPTPVAVEPVPKPVV